MKILQVKRIGLKHVHEVLISAFIFALLFFCSGIASGAEEKKSEPVNPNILLTVFLKHDQGKSLDEINAILDQQKFWQNFPPAGTSVVSWHVVMGIGQVVTLEVPANLLRSVNVAIEKHGWKAFRSEFYPTYDLYPVIVEKLKNKTRSPQINSQSIGDTK